MLLRKQRAIFVHIQKTGGSSVVQGLGYDENVNEKHFRATQLRELYGSKTFDAYFKFAFVRNPWDRLVSWWSMIDGRRGGLSTGEGLNKFMCIVLDRARTFEEFLLNCDEDIADSDGDKWIYRNQLDYITDAGGKQIVDFVGRYETIQQDMEFVMQKLLGKTVPMPHVNKSKHKHFTELYTPALADMVAERYAKDIEAFGYTFDVESQSEAVG